MAFCNKFIKLLLPLISYGLMTFIKCGNSPDGSAFCNKCGAVLRWNHKLVRLDHTRGLKWVPFFSPTCKDTIACSNKVSWQTRAYI